MGGIYGKDSIHAWLLAMCLMLGLCTSSFVHLNDDVLGLIVFKADLIDPTNALRLWTEDDNSPCNWTGIACDAHSARVITVHLNGLSLSGHIGRGLGKLTYLQNLSLAYNNLSGTLTGELAQLTQLKRVDFSHNMLSGPISSAFGQLISLKSLDFSHNLLSGAIPSELFSNCKGLHYLSLASNSLDGIIPYTIGSCLGLRTLNLSANHLIDAMPSSMGALTGLSVLDVSYNAISGSLPAISSNLLDMRLQSNGFSGVIGAQIGNCIKLQNIDLSNNFLSSELPDTMQRLNSLSTLNMADNIIYGNIPSWIGKLSALKMLNLSYNALYGQIPATLGLLKALESVDFSHNKLSGPIPSSFSSCVQLKSMDLSSNKLINTIPEKLLIPGLLFISLSGNLLTGKLPSVFFNQCGSLQTLDLSQNWLFGEVPLIATCAKMEYFNMSNNFLSGNILALHPGSAMVVIDLSHNQLSGNIPASLGDASRLSVLFLNGNKLNGSIPSALGSCSALTDINLSQNNLSSSIPTELGNLKSLEVMDLSYNNLSGTLPSELGQLQRLAELNVSYNQLQGPIPDNGIFVRFNMSAFLGNTDLCGAKVNVTCPAAVMPKPIVLNPNSTDVNPVDKNPLGVRLHKHMLLSASAILAISAAAAISAGVVIVLVLNTYAHSIMPRSNSHILHSFSSSPSSDMPSGKLVMFTKNSDPRAEEWITTAHALLNKDSELGRGGFGTVYKAVLADGRTVAIKKLMASSIVKSQEDFEKEIQFVGNIKHQNLLGLQGYYWTPHLQLLIYDFIPNGNLYSRLHEKAQADAPLGWAKRFRIALGTAGGLAHLHHACHPQVIHYNMKSSNILLDEHYNPKIADYGLAKLLPMLDKYLMSSKFQGALGYRAPEFACQSSRINEKCDVYGYGVMLLELVTGRRPVEYREDDVVILCDYVRSLLDEGKAMSCVDPNMQDYVEDEVLPVIKLGLICTSQVPSNRPSMAEVVQILELITTSGSNSRDLL